MSLFPSLSSSNQQITPQQPVTMPSQPQLTQSTPQTMALNSSTTQATTTTQATSSTSYRINWKTDSFSKPQQPTPAVSNPSIKCFYDLIIRSSYGNSNCNGNDWLFCLIHSNFHCSLITFSSTTVTTTQTTVQMDSGKNDVPPAAQEKKGCFSSF